MRMSNKLINNKILTFFTINVLAGIGINIGVIGVAWFIIKTTGKNEVLGIYGTISLLTAFVVMLFSGSLIDKFNKISIMKYSAITQALVFVIVLILYVLSVPALVIIYTLALINIPGIMLFSIASRGAIPLLIGKENISLGNSVIEISVQIGAIFAGVLTGFLYHLFGFGILILTGSCLMLASAVVLHYVKHEEGHNRTSNGDSFILNLSKGFKYLIRSKIIFLYGLIVFVPSIIISSINTVLPGYVEQYLREGSLAYGAGEMLFAGGALLAGVLMSSVRIARNFRFIDICLFIVGGICLLYFSFNTLLSGFFITIFIFGLSFAGLRIVLTSELMRVVDGKYLGRCLALLTAISLFLQAGFSYLLGFIMDKQGANIGFVMLFVIICISFFLFIMVRPRLKSEKEQIDLKGYY